MMCLIKGTTIAPLKTVAQGYVNIRS